MHEHVSIARDDDAGIAHNLNINRELCIFCCGIHAQFQMGGVTIWLSG